MRATSTGGRHRGKNYPETQENKRVHALSVLGFLGSTSALDEATLKEEAHASLLQAHTMPDLLTFFALVPCASVGSTYWGSVSLALLPGLERPLIRAHSSVALPKFVQLVTLTVPPFTPSLPNGKQSSSRHQWLVAPWRPMSRCATLIVLAALPTLHAIINKRPPRPCSATRFKNEILLY